MPVRKNQSEVVYYEAATAINMLGSDIDSSEISSSLSDVDHLPSRLQNYKQESSTLLYKSGLIINSAIKETCVTETNNWPPTASDMNITEAKSSIPTELFNLLAWCTGRSTENGITHWVDVDVESYHKLISICQDIINMASKKTNTPKSLALGLAVRHLTGSSHIANILNRLGHCASSDTIKRLETGLAKLQLCSEDEVPTGFEKEKPTILVWDNIDFGEETLSGHGTTHHTNGIMIQACISKAGQQSLHKLTKERSLEPRADVLVEYHRTKRHGPTIAGSIDQLDANHYQATLASALLYETAFSVCKFVDSSLPGWTGFNTLLHKDPPVHRSAINYMPVIEASPTEMKTVKTILDRSISVADRLSLEEIVLVFDQAIYAKVQEIRWLDETLLRRTVVRLGEFHTMMSFLSIIGKRFKDAGLTDILIESQVVAEGSINGVISGHHYNRSIRSHKLLYEALQRMRLAAYINTLPTEESDSLIKLFNSAAQQFPKDNHTNIIMSDQFTNFVSSYNAYVADQSVKSPTFSFWSSYIRMVELLLTFLRATRTSDWELHLASVRFMLPWFFAYDRTNYARYLPVYWLEMVNLPQTHEVSHRDLSIKGQWTVQRQDNNLFASIACDQAIEQTCNRDSKTKGGVIGMTQHRGAVQRWILAQPQHAAITRQCELMAGINDGKRNRKDLDSARIASDEIAVNSIIATISQMINPFINEAEELISLSSGVVASADVKVDLLEAENNGHRSLQG